MKQLLGRFSLVVSLNLISLLFSGAAKGQPISPDGTLPTNVDLSGKVFEITGGATEGNNLFHSFSEFSVPNSFEAYFKNGLSIENIISRVTGGSISSIDGLIKANGSANLILINPAGISFGSGASLDIGGAFLGSSGNSIRFEDGTVFSADPNQTPLLTVTAPIGVGFAPNPGEITSQGANLTLESGKTLALIGGNVTLDSTSITTPSGNIEIASVGGNESVSLTAILQGWELGFEGVNNFQDIQFSLGTLKSGEINIQGQDISLTSSILKTEGAMSNNPGLNEVSGDISIIGRDISIAPNSRLAATERKANEERFNNFSYSPFGGNITIQGRDITISQGAEATLPTIFTRGEFGAGDITIEGRNITITEGSRIQMEREEFFNPVDTIDADSLSNQLSGTIRIDGEQIIINDSVGISSEIWNGPNRIQDVPDPNIEPGSILIGTKTSGNRITISGTGTQIITDTHGFHDEGQIPGFANSIEIGNENSEQVIIQGLSEIAAESHPHEPDTNGRRTDFDSGRAGSIRIRGQEVNIKGEEGIDEEENTRITATAFGTRSGGGISIEGGNIAIEDRAVVVAETSGATPGADGGSIFIGRNNPDNQIIIDNATVSVRTGDTIAESHGPSGARVRLGNAAAGNIFIGNSNSNINILNDSDISASTIFVKVDDEGEEFINPFTNSPAEPGMGDAGTIEIDADEFNLIQDAVVASETETFGDAGNIVLAIGGLLNIDNAEINVTSSNQGTAGNINIITDSLFLNEGKIRSNTQTGEEGNITINSRQAILRNNSQIVTNSTETSDGGNITFTSLDFIALLNNSDITANAGQVGQGGVITIDTQGVFQCGDCEIRADGGEEGIVSINTPDVQNTLEFLEVPQQVISSEQVVVSACATEQDRQTSQFMITGRGGLPPSPTSPLTTEALINFDADNELQQNSEKTNNLNQDSAKKEYPSPARGWYVNAEGNLILAANIPNGNPNNSGVVNPDCNSVSHNH